MKQILKVDNPNVYAAYVGAPVRADYDEKRLTL